VRKHKPTVKVAPQLHGGGHEHGMRSGTLYTPQIVGFAKAIQLALTEMDHETQRLTQLRENLWCSLRSLEGVFLNGHPSQRLPGNLNISVAGVESGALLLGMQPIAAVSSGSACTSAKVNPSHVLKALGRSTPQALASIRFGLGRFTTAQEIDAVATETV
ncbi:MAG: aminotransferase class V-fold PLP-dependent enzyme, partial [Synechococcales cyanobacterium]